MPRAARARPARRRSTRRPRPSSRSGDDRVDDRVGLLVVGHVDPKSRHVAGDYPELFARAARAARRRARALRRRRRALPGVARRVRRLDLLAEPALGVRRRTVDRRRRGAHARDRRRRAPFVGICFGHQLLAQALGGTVERAADGWGVGVQRLRRSSTRSPWMEPALDAVALIASHQDQVVEVPADARVIATVATTARSRDSRSASGRGRCRPTRSSSRRWPTISSPAASSSSAPERVAPGAGDTDAPLDRPPVARWIANFFVD